VSKELSPNKLYTLEQVADYCGRGYQCLRFYYSQGLLADPINTTGTPKRKIRMFTYMEARQLRDFFRTVQPGTISRLRRQVVKKRGKKSAA
jgi:hypothetical protein